MNNTDLQVETQTFDLLDSLDQEWLKLPLVVMRDCGPAAQTLAGILKITNRETYVSASKIARHARLPLGTVRKQLRTLNAAGWIINAGREATRRGVPRRTCTLKLTKRAIEGSEDYGILPWWACCHIRNLGKLSWSSKSVLSLVTSRLASLKKAVYDQDGESNLDADDVWDSIELLGGDDRFCFSLTRLQRDTGLTRESIISAKRQLHRIKIIQWLGDEGSADILKPNEDLRIVKTPASAGKMFLDFEMQSEFG